jgi:hypothetical protein
MAERDDAGSGQDELLHRGDAANIATDRSVAKGVVGYLCESS